MAKIMKVPQSMQKKPTVSPDMKKAIRELYRIDPNLKCGGEPMKKRPMPMNQSKR